MDQRLNLPTSARLLLLGNAVLLAPALWETVKVLNHLEYRWTPLTAYRAPLLGLLIGVIFVLIVVASRGSHRAVNWMLTLFSFFVGTCIWEGASSFRGLERSGIDLRQIGIVGWLGILWGSLSFVWLGLNFWYFYGRWGMSPLTR